jgi:hypothetical protein
MQLLALIVLSDTSFYTCVVANPGAGKSLLLFTKNTIWIKQDY